MGNKWGQLRGEGVEDVFCTSYIVIILRRKEHRDIVVCSKIQSGTPFIKKNFSTLISGYIAFLQVICDNYIDELQTSLLVHEENMNRNSTSEEQALKTSQEGGVEVKVAEEEIEGIKYGARIFKSNYD